MNQIRLLKPFKDVTPFKYNSTPAKGKAELGVVGYSQERDHGKYLYEKWQLVEIDLAKSGALLNYTIDPIGGK